MRRIRYITLALLLCIGIVSVWLMLEYAGPTRVEVESRNEDEEGYLQAAIRSMAWNNEELVIEYVLTFLRRQPGVTFSKQYATVCFLFQTADGARMNVRKYDHFGVDEYFHLGWKPIVFDCGHVRCDSMTATLRVNVPEGAKHLEVQLGSHGPVTKPVRIPDQPKHDLGR